MRNIIVLGLLALCLTALIIRCGKEAPVVQARNLPPAPPLPGAITTASGLQYVDLITGTGKTAADDDHVSVLFTGWLTDGTQFDNSLDKNNPFKFEVGETEVNKGWDEGVTGMKVGGKRKMIIPPALGFGAKGKGNVPPNATLIYEIELLAIQ